MVLFVHSIMKKTFLIIAILLYSYGSYAQKYYSRMFDLYGWWEAAFEIIEVNSNSNIIFCDGVDPFDTINDSLRFNCVFISSYDSSFHFSNNLLFAAKYYDVGYLSLLRNDKKLLLCFIDTVLHNTHFYYKLFHLSDNYIDTLFGKTIEYPIKELRYTNTLESNSKIYIIGTEGRYQLSPLAILCIDTSGNTLWYKKYANLPCYITHSTISEDGNILVSGFINKGDNITDTSYGWYAKMDTAGNFIWTKSITEQRLTDTYGIINIEKSNYIYMNNDASSNTTDNKDSSYAAISKIDMNGIVKWTKRYLNNPYKKACNVNKLIYSEGALYGIGNYETNEGAYEYTQYLSLLKLDLQGNLLWKRLFKQWYENNLPSNMIESKDGGFIICGTGKDTTHTRGYSDAWIIKTDTNGCIVPGCNAKDGMVQIINPEKLFKVYPNPAKEIVNVEVITPNTLIKNISIYNNQAQMVLSQNMVSQSSKQSISVSSLANGYYTLVIELQDGSQAAKKIVIEK